MNVKAKINLKETKLLWQQTTLCYTEIANEGEETLRNINSSNWKGSATIRLTNLENGETSYHARKLMPEIESPGISLPSGGMLADEIVLSNVLHFPSCGTFELRSVYEWNNGKVESNPIRVEIISSNPVNLMTETTRGSQIGDVYCVWVNKEKDENTLYLSMIDTAFEPKIEWSDKIDKIVDSANPSISIPANNIPKRQYIAWISHNKLHYVMCEQEKFQSNVFELDADDYEIIPPLLEDSWIEGVPHFAEVLLFRKDRESWRIRTVLLGEKPSMSREVRVIKSVPPLWFRTVYRRNGARFTFVLLPQLRDGNPYMKLAMSLWKPRVLPAYPVFLTNWQGILITADVLLAGDDRIVGAGLIKQESGGQTEYVIQKWSLDKNDELQLSTMPPLLWNEKWTIEHAILRVNGEGATFILLKGGPEGKWFWVNGAGEITSLGELSSQISLPANIIFVSQIYPAVLYADKTCGLKLSYLGPKRVYRPPTGAW